MYNQLNSSNCSLKKKVQHCPLKCSGAEVEVAIKLSTQVQLFQNCTQVQYWSKWTWLVSASKMVW